jgi:hypothetical protein
LSRHFKHARSVSSSLPSALAILASSVSRNLSAAAVEPRAHQRFAARLRAAY